MKTDLEAILIIIGITIVILFACRAVNASHWNNGYCSCGGRWTYQQPVGHMYDTTFMYQCDKCGKTVEFFNKYAEVKK